MTLPHPDLEALLATAKAATPGPWTRVSGPSFEGVHSPLGRVSRITMDTRLAKVKTRATARLNAAHIAACDPTTIIAIVNELICLREFKRHVEEHGPGEGVVKCQRLKV